MLPDAKRWFRINVIGGLYSEVSWRQMWEGIVLWASKRPPTAVPVAVDYYGTDRALFHAWASRDAGRVVADKGFVAPGVLAQAVKTRPSTPMSAFCGISSQLLELLSCGRPLLVCPKERAESKRFCVEVGGVLLEAETSEAIASMLDRAEADWNRWAAPAPNSRCQRFSWDAQTERLERVCVDVARSKRPRASVA